MKKGSSSPSRILTITGYYAFILIGTHLVLVPTLIRSIGHDFAQNDAAFGVLYFVGALLYATGAFSGGRLIERVGRRTVLCAGALALAAGFLAEAASPVWALLLIAYIPVNWGAGVLDSGVNGMFLDLFREARGSALNVLHMFFSVGGFVAPALIGQLVTAGVGWRVIALSAGVVSLPLALLLAVLPMPSGLHSSSAVAEDRAAAPGAEASLRPFVFLALAIGLYVAAEISVTNWIVRFLANVPVATATAALSALWAGIALGRFLSNWLVERIDYFVFTISCAALSGLTLLGAVVSPWFALTLVLIGLTGVFYGPIYPMIMALGGNIYPRRLATLSGGLAASAVTGGMIYPPLMGLLAGSIGLRAGMIGAALLGHPMALCLFGARATARIAQAQAAPR